jgi:alpha-methylacyl-CoA racemase
MSAIFKTRTRAEWCTILEGTDSCVTPVLTLEEAPRHPHMTSRNTFDCTGGHPRPGAAPRFRDADRGDVRAAQDTGSETDAILRKHGFADHEIRLLREAGTVG